ncbi:MAG: bifunctional diguanylate cyclase/phosphodiesterase [Nocardioidaceae bacterium]
MRRPRGLRLATYVALTVYACVVVAAPHLLPSWARDVLVGNLPFVGAAALLVRRAASEPEQRSWTLPLALATTVYLLGNIAYMVQSARGDVMVPSVADVGYLAAYPLLVAGLMLALRADLRGVRLIVALDGLSGTLAGSAVVTWAIAPLVARVWDGSLAAATTLAYPVCAAVAVAVTFGAVGMVGRSRGRGFLVWALGLLLFGGADVVYAYRLAYDSYQPGTWLDALWAVGLVLVAAGATSLRPAARRTVPGARSLVVVAIAAVSTVGVLAAAPPWHENSLPSVLALLALATCSVRLVLAFLQLGELAAVRELALTDELTGAANRRALYQSLDDLFAREGAPSRRQRGFALALIDLDHFKEVNDSFGHATGDELLQAVVHRFSGALDQLQTPHLFARLGGDEFAVILHEVDSFNAAMACGSALAESLSDPIELRDAVLHAQASIGIATAPLHATNRGDMLFAADAAMYAAKTSGQVVAFHSPTAVGDRRKRLVVAEDLYTALERHELTVEYQPILTVEGALVGTEALVRWDHPTRGRLSPAEFLEAAERYKLTSAIAERVLDVALGDLARWRRGGADLTMSVNVSTSDLRDEGLVQLVAAALIAHDVPPAKLTIEITESAMMSDPGQAQAVMQALADLGVRLSVDDYGTGYSSLEYLLKLPIHEIKLDQTFCSNIVTELRATAIVRSTVDLTHALGLRMVAEGVENAGTLFVLRELGCDLVQGWLLGRPMPAQAFEVLLAQQLQPDPRRG